VDNKNNKNSKYNNNNNNNNTKKILVISIALVFLLSSAIFSQNQIILLLLSQSSSLSLSSPSPSLAYADKIKIKNKSLIKDISDQVVKSNDDNNGNSKDELQNILQQIQTQISLIAGQDKATNVIKQIKSVTELNPNGPLSQSLLSLAKQQTAGNIEDVNKVTTDIAKYAATGSGTDGILLALEQSVAATLPPSPPPPSSSLSAAATQYSPQLQPQQQQLLQQQASSPSPSLPAAATTSTIASFSNNNTDSNIVNDSSSLSASAQLPQITSQLTQPQLSLASSSPSSESSPSTATGLSSSQSLPPPMYNNNLEQQQEHKQQQQQHEQEQQLQIQQSEPPEQQQAQLQSSSMSSSSLTSSPSAYPTNGVSNYNNVNNATDANTVMSNSSPHSTIKVTSVDQPAMSSSLQLQPSPYAASPSSENEMSQPYNSAGNYNSIANLMVNAGTSVTLNGDSSHDPDGDSIGFKWEQISGPRVTLNGDNTSEATFAAPSVYNNTTMLFKLTVTDQNGLSDSKTVQITVTPTSSIN
jgi:hypothetical protein